MQVSRDFEEFLALLNKHSVRYLIIGGYAFAIHARPRFTNDIDIFFDTEKENAGKILKVLDEFGFGSLGITAEDLLDADQVIQLGYAPYRIDLISGIANVDFEGGWSRKVYGTYGSQKVPFIGKEDLIASKRGAGRKRDLQDLDELLGK